MKYRTLIYIVFIGILTTQCSSLKIQKDIDNLTQFLHAKAETQHQKEEVLKFKGEIERGHKLYKANCASCHGIFNKAKDGIPDFSNEQIDDYGAAFIKRDKNNHAVAMKMSKEQLDNILSFLYSRNIAKQLRKAQVNEKNNNSN